MTLIVSKIAIVVILLLVRANATKKMTLRLGVLVSQSGEVNLSGYIPSMDLALETINNDTTLPFDFHVPTVSDSMCQASPAIHSFFHQITSIDNMIMMIGAGCSVSTEPVAELTPHWNIVQISPTSGSPRLSDNETFPLFLRTASGEQVEAVTILQAMKQFGWSRIAVITQAEKSFIFVAATIRQELANSSLQLIREYTFSTEPKEAVDVLRNSPARIIFLNMYSVHAAEALCQAYKNKMFYPTYAWILFNWYTDMFWVTDNPSCIRDGSVKAKDLEGVLNKAITLEQYPQIKDEHVNEPNVGNITWNQYASEHAQRFSNLTTVRNDTNSLIFESAFMFDAMWTAALALNRTQARLNKKNLTLLNFTYDDKYNISDMIYEEALNVSFFGLTGDVSFLPNGDRPAQLRLLQYRATGDDGSLKKQLFARIIDGNFVYENGESDSTVYPDGIPQDEKYIYISLPLFIIYTIIAVIGIIFTAICLAVNLWFREQKLVKLSSPYVNIMIVAGAIVFYVMVILFGVDENVASYSTVDGLCHARIWLVSIGFNLLYGTIFAKSWRIYYIFSHSKPNSKFEVKDIYLFGIVGALVAADIVFLIPVTVVRKARLRREYEEIEGNHDDDVPQIFGVCTSDGSLEWLPVLFAYKGFILLAGLFLAFETRKVKIKSLKDSRFIAMSVYGAVVAAVTLTPIGFLLQHFPSAQYAIIGIMILFSTSLILGLVFATKWYKVYQDPEGTRSLEKSDDIDVGNSQSQKAVVNGTDENYYKNRIVNLNKEIIDLNKRNKALNDELVMVKGGQAGNTGMMTTKDVKMDDTAM